MTTYKKIRTDLVRVSTYAKQIGTSVTWVYQLAKKGKIEIVSIDDVNFVKIQE